MGEQPTTHPNSKLLPTLREKVGGGIHLHDVSRSPETTRMEEVNLIKVPTSYSNSKPPTNHSKS